MAGIGGHAINQTWQNAMMETAGLKATDVVQVGLNLNDGCGPCRRESRPVYRIGIGAPSRKPTRWSRFASWSAKHRATNKILNRYGASVVVEPVTG